MLDVDDLYPEHPKLLGLGTWCEVAGWLNVAALAWCKRYLTDGVIPRAAVWRLASFRGMTIDGEPVTPEAVATKLVEAGLWRERGVFYVIHDYLEYQESRATILARREAFRRRQRKHRDSLQESDVTPDVTRDTRVTHADVTRDASVTNASPSPSPSGTDLPQTSQASRLDPRSGARARARSNLEADAAGRARTRAEPHRAEPRTRPEAQPALVR